MNFKAASAGKTDCPAAAKFQTKPQLAGDLIEEALSEGLSAAPVPGDSVYGNAPELRTRLRRPGPEYVFNA